MQVLETEADGVPALKKFTWALVTLVFAVS